MLLEGLWELPISPAATLLAQAAWLNGIYVVCLIVGGGLLIVSTVLGGDGAHADADFDINTDAHLDFGADADADIDLSGAGHADLDTGGHGDFDADAGDAHDSVLSISNWFSVRFLVYFAAGFGLVGTTLTHFSDMGSTAVFCWSLISGLVIGQGVHQMLRLLKKTSGDGSTRVEQYINRDARVTIAIHPPQRGEVAIHVGDGERFVPAIANREDDQFEVGAAVVVVAFRGGTAEVLTRREYEFTKSD